MSAGLLAPTTLIGLGAALLAGLVRGFSGFGSGMILTPALSALYGPAAGVPIALVLEVLVTVPLLPQSVRLVEWRRISLLSLAAFIALPAGVWLLLHLPARLMRIAISAVILGFVAILAFGWRYRGRPLLVATLATGAVSGLLNGASAMGGPPVVFYYLSGSDPALRIRASFIVYFALIDIVALLILWLSGGLDLTVLVRAALLTPLLLLAAWAGARFFRRAGEAFYRRIALTILALIALASLAA